MSIVLILIALFTVSSYHQKTKAIEDESVRIEREANSSIELTLAQREYEKREEARRAERQAKIDRVSKMLEGRPYQIYAETFVDASERSGLDIRLLPSICIAESGCGRVCVPHKNCWGWSANNYKKIGTPEEEIYFIAEQLATKYPKDPIQALIKYNGDSEYLGLTLFKSF